MNVLRFSDLVSEGQVRGRRVFVRSDLNVPLDAEGEIADDTRIRASLPCLKLALEAGAAVMVTSHLGRPGEGALHARDSLAPVARRLAALLRREVPLVRDWGQGRIDSIPVSPGEIVVLENCRGNVGEKNNDPALARAMAAACDIFVHDAFGTAHRAEASTYGIAEHAPIACAGPLLAGEIDAICRALERPARPLVAIVGGSKVSTKLNVLHTLIAKVDQLIVGGGIANTFLLAAGMPIGKSLAERELVAEARAIMAQHRGVGVPVPTDVVVARELSPEAKARTVPASQVGADEMILDIGPRSAAELATILARAGTIVWNGPMGVFEHRQFACGTRSLAAAIAHSSAFSIAGGGDTLAAVAQFGVESEIDYISTGGGAFLEMLEGRQLPALEVLQRRAAGVAR